MVGTVLIAAVIVVLVFFASRIGGEAPLMTLGPPAATGAADPSATASPADASTTPRFTFFTSRTEVQCAPDGDQPPVEFSWETANALEVWFTPDDTDAVGTTSIQLPLNGNQADLDAYPHLQGAQPGDLILEDYNKDGKITADDQVRSKYGNVPLLTYGLTFNAGYDAFDIALVFAGQGMVSQYVLPESGQVGNFYSSWADNRWSPSNPDGSFPRVDTRASSSINGGLYANNFWLNNSSFVRLKNVELGYTLPKDALAKLKISSLRIYASAFNLFTITGVKDYDPEGNNESGQFYPQQRIMNLGLNIKF